MRDIILALDRFGDQALLLGRVGENRATRVLIKLESILSRYPDAVASITVKQPGRAEYPAAVKQEDGTLTWEITRADIGDRAGSGQAQITIQDADGTIIKTEIARTRIGESLGDATAPVPDPVETWIDKATGTLADVERAGNAAQAVADEVQRRLDDGDFVGPQGQKGDRGETGPIGPQGIKGEKGDKGDKGDQGDTGPQGETGAKGDAFTYDDFTPEQLASLRGPKGDTGATGPRGETGAAGPQGPQGEPGKDAVIDATLTRKGEAADAKAAGEALNQLKEDLVAFDRKVCGEEKLTDITGETIPGYVKATNGVLGTGANYIRTNYIDVSDNADYKYSGVIYNWAGIAGYDGNLKYVQPILYVEESKSVQYKDELLTIPASVKYIVATSMSKNSGLTVSKTTRSGGDILALQDKLQDKIDNIKNDMSMLKEYASVSLFELIGVVGDSFSSGGIPNAKYTVVSNHYDISWPQIMARRTGCSVTNYSSTGSDISRFLCTDKGYGYQNWNIEKLESDSARNLYIIYMGINKEKPLDNPRGSETVPNGTIEDIDDNDYTQNADTFCGHYGQLMSRIKTHAPSAKIILVQPTQAYNTDKGTQIANIAAHYNVPLIVLHDDSFYSSACYKTMGMGHPYGIGYSGMAVAMERQIAQAIVDNIDYFKDYLIG